MKTKTITATFIVLIGLYVALTHLVVAVTTAASLVGLIFRSLLSGEFGQFLSHGVMLATTSSSVIVGLILIFLARRITTLVLRISNLDGDETHTIGDLRGAATISVALLGLFLLAQNLGGVLGGSLELVRSAVGGARSTLWNTHPPGPPYGGLMTQYATRLIACGIGVLLVMSPHRVSLYIMRKTDD